VDLEDKKFGKKWKFGSLGCIGGWWVFLSSSKIPPSHQEGHEKEADKTSSVLLQ
jgi:hypothetical protein